VINPFQYALSDRFQWFGYGYHWWINDITGYFIAAGEGGPDIHCVPDKNIVIVATSESKYFPLDGLITH